MRIHLAMGGLAIGLGFYVHLSRVEWMMLVAVIGQVLLAETINTAFEVSIDLITRKASYRAMLGKDLAAAAVLISAIQSLAVGYFLFFDKLCRILL